METIGLLLGGSWASGVNLYLTTAALGLAYRFHWLDLPGELSILAHPLIIVVALVLYAVEFFADKIPLVDSAWDSVHTFIRPVGGLALGYMAMADAGPAVQMAVGMITGSIALDAHLTKATSRAAINTSPEPVTNSVASVTEDVSVAGAVYLIIQHPVVASICVIVFIIFSIWFLKKMFHLVKKIFSRKKDQPESVAPDEPSS